MTDAGPSYHGLVMWLVSRSIWAGLLQYSGLVHSCLGALIPFVLYLHAWLEYTGYLWVLLGLSVDCRLVWLSNLGLGIQD